MLSRTTQATLLARLADRDDRAAWNEFCIRYRELIRGFARRRGVQDHDCDDIVQEVLIALTSSMPRFQYDPEKGRFRAYLKTATIRAVFKKSFQRDRPVSLQEMEFAVASDSVSEAVDLQWEAEWRQYHLRLAMRTIEAEFNAADRNAFQLYAVEGRGARDTAAAAGLTVDGVYQAKSRILRRLAQLVAEQVAEEG